MREFVDTILSELQTEGWSMKEIATYAIVWVVAFSALLVLGSLLS